MIDAMINLPPPQWDYPYRGELVINYVLSLDEMNRRCGMVQMQALGCAFKGDGHCTILVWRRVPDELMAALLRHEIAHCNGWPADHRRD